MLLKKKVKESLDFLNPGIGETPLVAVVLGSGLGGFVDSLKNATVIETKTIPHYPVSTVPGHKGRWVIGDVNGVRTLAIQGRVHYYEGYPLQQVSYYIHLLAGLGIKTLIVTTACGGLNPEFHAGDLMLISDQINLAFNNPLIGKPDDQLGPRFPDMSKPYDADLLAIAERVGIENDTPFRKGVFCWMTGPNYETAAEVRMLQKLGVDAVSMSTAPEVIVASQRHLRVLGISLITNPATGLANGPLTHADVTHIAAQAGQRLSLLLKDIIRQIALDSK